MSKGPGKQQKRILDELNKRPVFYLAILATTHTEYKSLSRAAKKLHDAGLINKTFGYNDIVKRHSNTDPTVIIYKAGPEQRYEVLEKILSVEQVPSWKIVNTYRGGAK